MALRMTILAIAGVAGRIAGTPWGRLLFGPAPALTPLGEIQYDRGIVRRGGRWNGFRVRRQGRGHGNGHWRLYWPLRALFFTGMTNPWRRSMLLAV